MCSLMLLWSHLFSKLKAGLRLEDLISLKAQLYLTQNSKVILHNQTTLYSGILEFQPWISFSTPLISTNFLEPNYQLLSTYSLNSKGVKSRVRSLRNYPTLILPRNAFSVKTNTLPIKSLLKLDWFVSIDGIKPAVHSINKSIATDLVLDWGFFFPSIRVGSKGFALRNLAQTKTKISLGGIKRFWRVLRLGKSYWNDALRFNFSGGTSLISKFSNPLGRGINHLKRLRRIGWLKFRLVSNSRLKRSLQSPVRTPLLGWLGKKQSRFSPIKRRQYTLNTVFNRRSSPIHGTKLRVSSSWGLTKGSDLRISLPEILTTDSHPRRVLEFQPEPLDFTQPVVRYKPGFSTHWRFHRGEFQKKFLDSFSYRQKRLTKSIIKLRRLASYSYLKAFQLSLSSLVKRSLLSQNPNSVESIRGGWVFLNGVCCANPYTQLYVGDIIVLTSNLLAIDHSLLLDSPSYLEVDELTSSISLVVEPRFWNSDSSDAFPALTAKCYNWKYIT